MEKSPGELRFIQSKLQHLEIQLIDIEEGLRFSQRGSTVIRQNFSRSLKIFYEIDEFLVSSLKPTIYNLLRKLIECVSLGFCKVMDMLTNDKFYQQNSQPHNTQQIKVQSSKTTSRQQQKRVQMGGAVLDEERLRGIEQIKKVETSVPVPDNLQLCWQDIKQQEEINSVVMEIRAFMNNHFSKSLTPDGSIQMRLLSILNYFNDCEKQAVSFLDNRTWTDNINIQLSFEAFLNRIEDKKQNHEKLLVRLKAICDALSKVSKHDKTITQKEVTIAPQLNKGQSKLSFLQRTANKAVQTVQVLDISMLEQFLNEKNQLLESEVKQNEVLVSQVYQYKNMLEDQKNLKAIYMSESQRFNSQLHRMKSIIEPLSVEKQEVQQKYSQLRNKVDNLCDMDVKDCINDFTKEYSLEMQMSIIETINAILLRMGITKQDERNIKAQKKRHKFRVGIFRPFEGQNLQSEYLDELQETKVQLKSRSKSRARTRKMESPTDSVFDPAEASEPQTPVPSKAQPAFEQVAHQNKQAKQMSESDKQEPVDVIKPLNKKSSDKQENLRNSSSYSKRPRQSKQSFMLIKPKKQNGKSTSVLSHFNNNSNSKVQIRNSVNITHRLSKLTKVQEKQPVRASHMGSYVPSYIGKISHPKTSFATAPGFGIQHSFFRGLSDCCQQTQTDLNGSVSVGINTLQPPKQVDKYEQPKQMVPKQQVIVEDRGIQTETYHHAEEKASRQSPQFRQSPLYRQANLIKSTKIAPNTNLPGILSPKDRVLTRLNDETKENHSPHLINIPGIQMKKSTKVNIVSKNMHRHSQVLDDDTRHMPTAKQITHRIHTQADSPGSMMRKTKIRRVDTQENHREVRSFVGVSNWINQFKNIDKVSTTRKLTETKEQLSQQQIWQMAEKLMKSKKQKIIRSQLRELADSIDLPIYSTSTPIRRQIKQLRQAHRIQCHQQFCQHLLRFYQNLRKIINRQSIRQPLSLKQFKISAIDHVD